MKLLCISSSVSILFAFLLPGCESSDAGMAGKMSGPKKVSESSSVHVQFQPEANSQYRYLTKTEMVMKQMVNGEETESSTNTSIQLRYDIRKDTTAQFQLKLTYEGFTLNVNLAGTERELDARTASQSSNPEERIFGALHNASVQTVIDTQGRIIAIKGIPVITNKMYELAGGSPQAVQAVKGFTTQYFTEAALKTLIGQQISVLPNKTLQPGISWTQEVKVSPDISLTYPITYTLSRIEDGIAVVTIKGDIAVENQSVNLNGYSLVMSLNGEQKGSMMIDMATGMLMESTSNFTAEGSMQMMGMQVPVSLKTKTTVKGVRL